MLPFKPSIIITLAVLVLALLIAGYFAVSKPEPELTLFKPEISPASEGVFSSNLSRELMILEEEAQGTESPQIQEKGFELKQAPSHLPLAIKKVTAWVLPNNSLEVAAVAGRMGSNDHILLLDQWGQTNSDPEMVASFIIRSRTPRIQRAVISSSVPEALAKSLQTALGDFPSNRVSIENSLANEALAKDSSFEVIWLASPDWSPYASALAAAHSSRHHNVVLTSQREVFNKLITEGREKITEVVAFGGPPPTALSNIPLKTISDSATALLLLEKWYGSSVPERVAVVYTGAQRKNVWPLDFFSSAALATIYTATRARLGYGAFPVQITSYPLKRHLAQIETNLNYDPDYRKYDEEISNRLNRIPKLSAIVLISHWLDIPYNRTYLIHQPSLPWGEQAVSGIIPDGEDIAADGEYADLDGDLLPDLPWSRIAGHTPAQASLLMANGLDLLRGSAERATGYTLMGVTGSQPLLEALYPGKGQRISCYYKDIPGKPYYWNWEEALRLATKRDKGEIVVIDGHNVCDPRDDAQEIEFAEKCDSNFVPQECQPSPADGYVKTHVLMSSKAVWEFNTPSPWPSFWIGGGSSVGIYNPLENDLETSFPRALARWGTTHYYAPVGHNLKSDCPTPPIPSCFGNDVGTSGGILKMMNRLSVQRRPAWALQIATREEIISARKRLEWDQNDGILAVLLGDPLAGYNIKLSQKK